MSMFIDYLVLSVVLLAAGWWIGLRVTPTIQDKTIRYAITMVISLAHLIVFNLGIVIVVSIGILITALGASS